MERENPEVAVEEKARAVLQVIRGGQDTWWPIAAFDADAPSITSLVRDFYAQVETTEADRRSPGWKRRCDEAADRES